MPARAHAYEAGLSAPLIDAKNFEDARVAGAIQTYFTLPAEIITIALAAMPDLPLRAGGGAGAATGRTGTGRDFRRS